MPLKLVLGPANSAKAGEVLAPYALESRRDALLVVPTAADVAHYARELAQPGVTLGRTLTFPGLIDELATRTNLRLRRLTALQRERVLRRAIAAVRLDAFAHSAAGAGFAPAAGRLIVELQQHRVTPARFRQALRGWAGAAAERAQHARELAAIYRRYVDDLKALDRVDEESFAWQVLDALRERPESWGATPVFVYGFDDLTPVQLDTIETLARNAGVRVTVALTYEPGRPALQARATVVEDLRAIAHETLQLPALDDYYDPPSRAALHHLERHLFEPEAPTVAPGAAVRLMEAGGERAESELVAAEVLAAIAAGVPPDEIVVVCRSLKRSGELYENALARYGIPSFSARRVPLAHTALGRALLAATGYALAPAAQRSADDLLAYLRHPGVFADQTLLDEIEAELLRAGLQGRDAVSFLRRQRPLRTVVRDLEELKSEHDPAAALPQRARALLAGAHGGEARLLSPGGQLDARACAALIAALAEVRELDGDRPLPAAELLELLDGVQVAVHGPASQGAVLVAEPLPIRARRFRRVFVTGLCEGEFPSPQTVSADPFLGEERRRELALETGLALAQPADPLDRERYLLYACASRASECVTFSYRSSDEDGNVVIASPFLDDLAALFEPEWRRQRRRRLLADVVWTPEQAPVPRERAIAQAFAAAESGPVAGASSAAPIAAAGQRTGGVAATHVLSDAALARIRHRRMISAGGIERFARCPVRWLIEDQLEAQDLEAASEALARGNVMHTLLEQLFRELRAPLTPGTMPGAEQILDDLLGGGGGGRVAHELAQLAPGQPAAVRAAVLHGIEAELRRYLQFEAADGCDWTPESTELEFGRGRGGDPLPPLRLGEPGGESEVLISGTIDRVDRDPEDHRRVIVRDYKSGAQQSSWPVARWLSDNQLQVALYMLAVQQLRGQDPVAGFYQPLSGESLRPRGVFTAGAQPGNHTVATDEISEPQLRQLLEEIHDEVIALVATLRRGELTPCPQTCTPDGGCAHPGICWGAR